MRFLVSAFLSAALFAGCASSPSSADSETTIYLVRHAEKATEPADDPPLTPAGAARAAALADLLEDAGLEGVYSSQYVRSHDTVAPLAARIGLEVVTLPISGPDVEGTLRSQARQIAAAAAGSSAIVAGHSNTVPTMIAELTGTPMADLDEREYGDLFVVVLEADGSARLEHRRFGGPVE